MSLQVPYTKQFVLGIMFLLIILVVIEGLARGYDFFIPACEMTKSEVYGDNYFLKRQICLDNNLIDYDGNRTFPLEPNQHFSTININSYGFRGPEITQRNQEGTFRIFVVGGSTTFGSGSTSDETTIPGYLQKKFISADLDLNVEVINAGVGHATSTTEKITIKHMLVDFEPDLFIIYDGFNDAYKRQIGNVEPYVGTWQENKSEKNPLKFATYPFYRTPFVVYNIFFKPYLEPPGSPAPTDNDRISKVVSRWKNNWIEICELGEKKGFMTLLTVQPIVGAGNKSLTPYESLHIPKTEDHLATLKVLNGLAESLTELDHVCEETADLRNVFDNVTGPIYTDEVHVSDRGNEIMADKLFELALPIVKKSTE